MMFNSGCNLYIHIFMVFYENFNQSTEKIQERLSFELFPIYICSSILRANVRPFLVKTPRPLFSSILRNSYSKECEF